MRRIKTTISNEISVKGIRGFFERRVTKFGTGAIDAPKEYLGKKVIILVCDENEEHSPKAEEKKEK
ncbi:DUF2080 family transposase-associated protein [Candidatus Woesearchaeota archaeon]|nr:DUF2080 family transposase-associated protein [Candidatus Woesearchaeota archaeon]